MEICVFHHDISEYTRLSKQLSGSGQRSVLGVLALGDHLRWRYLGPISSRSDFDELGEGTYEGNGYSTVDSYSSSGARTIERAIIVSFDELCFIAPRDIKTLMDGLKHSIGANIIIVMIDEVSAPIIELGASVGFDDFLLPGDDSVMLLWKISRARREQQMYLKLNEARGVAQYFHALSMHDELTGLYNMRSFTRELSEHLRTSRSTDHGLALLMFDVDYFKRVNDQLSHLAGSQVLSRLGAVLRKNLRRHDIAARFGGDEFVVILTATYPCSAHKVALRLMERVAQEVFLWQGHRVHISLSCGLALYETPAASEVHHDDARPRHDAWSENLGKQLLMAADHRMYRAKDEGRGRLRDEQTTWSLVDGKGQAYPLTYVSRQA